MEKNIFSIATKEKYRFNIKGSMNIEDLWDCSLEVLDTAFKALRKQLKEYEDDSESLLSSNINDAKKEEINNKIEIIRTIAAEKQREIKEQQDRMIKQQDIAEIDRILQKKKSDSLENSSIEELEAKRRELLS